MGVLQNRNFSLLWIGRLISSYGDNLYALALPRYVYALTNSKLDLTVVGFADYMPAIAGFFVGTLVDRWHKRNVMLTSDAARILIGLVVFGTLLIVLPMWVVWMIIGCLSILGGLAYFVPVDDDLDQLFTSIA